MATDSIFHTIHLTDPKEIEELIEGLEAAERWAKEHEGQEIDVPPCSEMTREEVRQLFGVKRNEKKGS